MEVWLFRLLVVAAAALFVRQMLARYRLIARAPGGFDTSDLGTRAATFISEIVFQSRTIRARPVVGLAHLFVFWGFCAFAGYTTVEALRGLGVVDLTGTRGVPRLQDGARALQRRGADRHRPARDPARHPAAARARRLRVEGIDAHQRVHRDPDDHVPGRCGARRTRACAVAGVPLERVNWWTHMLVILAFTVLIPDSKHLHLLLSPATVFLRAPILGTVPKLDFEKEQTGLETVGQLEKKQVLDAFTCVECGRCQENCPAFATGKVLNPKTLILQNEEALLAGKLELPLKDLYDDPALWQCTTCGACQNECPVGVEHLPLIVNARRGLVSNGEAPSQLVPVYNHLERRGNIWGLLSEQRQKFIDAAGVEIFDPVKHDYVVWLGCAGAFEADFQKSLRALFDILRAKGVRFGVLAKEKCNGDVAKRTGNEYLFQELATSNVDDLKDAGVKKVITSCPHCLKTLGHDYREFGFEAEVVHSAVFVEELTRAGTPIPGVPTQGTVTYHDPCYLGRYAGRRSTSRGRCSRAPAPPSPSPSGRRPTRSAAAPAAASCSRSTKPGSASATRAIEQLAATGADTVVMACPFCSIMLKGAQASAGKAGADRRRRQDDGDDRPDVLRRRSPARRPRRRGGRRSAARDRARRSDASRRRERARGAGRLARVAEQAPPGPPDPASRRADRRRAGGDVPLPHRRPRAPGRACCGPATRRRSWCSGTGASCRRRSTSAIAASSSSPAPTSTANGLPASSAASATAPPAGRRRAAARARWSSCAGRWPRGTPPGSRSTARAGRRASPSPARCSCRRSPARRWCRSTSRRRRPGRRRAGTARRCRSRARRCRSWWASPTSSPPPATTPGARPPAATSKRASPSLEARALALLA